MEFDIDLHVHTHHSPCGQDEMVPGEILRTAAERGIAKLAITDHLYPFTDLSAFDEIRSGFADAGSRMNGSIEVFFGCEVEIMAPGRTAGSPELAERMDFVMAGATHFHNRGITDLPEGMDDHETARYILRTFEYAAGLPWVDVIAHPFFVIPRVCSGEVVGLLTNSELRPALELARDNDVALEISRRILHTPEQLQFSKRFYPLCKEVGLKFTVGSDAHRLEDVGNVRVLEPFINEMGLTEKDFRLPSHGSQQSCSMTNRRT